MFKKNPLIIAVDFDGTCVTHAYPFIGKDIGAVPILQMLVKAGHRLILWTMRSKEELQEAVDWFAKHNIPLFGVQTNPEQASWTTSPKAFANLYIDDAALGAPLALNRHLSDRPYINWEDVHNLLILQDIL